MVTKRRKTRPISRKKKSSGFNWMIVGLIVVVALLIGLWQMFAKPESKASTKNQTTQAVPKPEANYCAMLLDPSQKTAIINNYNTKTGVLYKTFVTDVATLRNTSVPTDVAKYYASLSKFTYPTYVQDLRTICSNPNSSNAISAWDRIQKIYNKWFPPRPNTVCDRCCWWQIELKQMEEHLQDIKTVGRWYYDTFNRMGDNSGAEPIYQRMTELKGMIATARNNDKNDNHVQGCNPPDIGTAN